MEWCVAVSAWVKAGFRVWNQDPTGKTSQKCADIGNLGSGRWINHVLKLLLCAKHCTRFFLVWIHFKGKCSNCAEFQGAPLWSCCHRHHSSTSASLSSSLQVRAPKSNFLPSNTVTWGTCKRSWKQTGVWAFGTVTICGWQHTSCLRGVRQPQEVVQLLSVVAWWGHSAADGVSQALEKHKKNNWILRFQGTLILQT